MKQFLRTFAILLCIALLPAATAETDDLCLTSPMFQSAEFVGSEEFDEGYSEVLTYDDGNMVIEVLGIDVVPEAEPGLVGEVSFEEWLELRFEGSLTETEELTAEPISAYPVRRVRFETGSNEDTCVVNAVAVWTDSRTFIFLASMSADAYYGYTDRYAEGEAPAMIDEWIASLEIFDPDAAVNVSEGDASQNGITLVADFSMGSENGETLPFEASVSTPVTAESLADALTEWVGLDFFITAHEEDDALYVDWLPESTLLAGLDDREQKEDFFFYDVDSLDWFMMDTLYATLQANIPHETIYYTMNGGETLVVPNIDAGDSFEAGVPYMGSAFYLNQDAE